MASANRLLVGELLFVLPILALKRKLEEGGSVSLASSLFEKEEEEAHLAHPHFPFQFQGGGPGAMMIAMPGKGGWHVGAGMQPLPQVQNRPL